MFSDSPKKEGFFTDQKSRKIAYSTWVPENPKAQIVLVHGFAEHSGSYFSLGDELYAHGYAVHMMDLPGHGRSEGRRGDIESFKEYLQTLHLFFEVNPDYVQGVKTFLLGHSLGGLISSLYCLRGQRQLDGLILSSPVMGFDLYPSFLFVLLAKWIVKGNPESIIPKPSHPGDLFSDPDKWEKYYQDPYRIKTIAPRLYLAIHEQTRYLQTFAHYLELPMLIFMGVQDTVVSSKRIQKFFSKVQSKDKTLVAFTNALHEEMFHGEEREDVVRKIKVWIDQKLVE